MNRAIEQAAAALQRGDPGTVRDLLDPLVSDNPDSPLFWVLLSRARGALGDRGGEEAAIDALLGHDAHSIPAQILKGDCLVRRGEERGGISFYRSALQGAARLPQIPPPLLPELDRIEAVVAEAGTRYRRHLETCLARDGLSPASVSRRFDDAFRILFGEKQAALGKQQPSVFYIPDLPQIEFYPRELFPWVEELESATGAICEELGAILREGGDGPEAGFTPYVQPERNRPHHDFHGLLGNPDWGAFYLIEDGAPHPRNAARCPSTMAAMAKLPLSRIEGRTPSVLFSLLRPGARIPPHFGMINARLIGHLPLVVPEGCALRVGEQTRPWVEGETLIFDDTIEHEAWNRSAQARVILLFDIWRPELDERERRAVAAMFRAIDRY
jgi:hypothetical protein